MPRPMPIIVGAARSGTTLLRMAGIGLSDFPSELAHRARLAGWFHGLAGMTRARTVRIDHDKCKAKGGPLCAWTLRWEK